MTLRRVVETEEPVTWIDQLSEALRAFDASMGMARKRYPELDVVQPVPAIIEAARLVVEGEDIWWCEEHGVLVRWDDATNCPAGAYKPETCRIVLRRMIDIPEIQVSASKVEFEAENPSGVEE